MRDSSATRQMTGRWSDDSAVCGPPGLFLLGANSVDALVTHCGMLALRGVFAFSFGAVAVMWPGQSFIPLVQLFASYLCIDGVTAIAAAWRIGPTLGGKALVVQAALDFAAAVLIIAVPALAIIVGVYITSFWAVLTGAALLLASARFGMDAWLMALAAAASILLGCLLLFAPLDIGTVLAVWLGLYALVFGTALLGLAWKLSALRREPAL